MEESSMFSHPAVYIVDGARTPFLKARTAPNPLSSSDLAVAAGQALLMRQPFAPDEIDQVVVGSTIPNPNETNIGRIVALRVGCGFSVPAMTVMRNCASGLQALDTAACQIMLGKSDLILAGGTDAMSQAPLLFNEDMTRWLAYFFATKTPLEKLKLIPQLRPHFFAPVISMLKGLSDPVVGINMGQTAENVAYEFGITRQEMDEYSMQSQLRTAKAQDDGVFNAEISSICDPRGKSFASDDGVRRDTTLEKLAKLKPFFDKKYGQITAGNSSQITDGAAMLILASKEAVERHRLPVLAKIVDCQWGALDPAFMGLGPAHAIAQLLAKQKLGIQDIDYWEINEAFAAQVIGCVKALAQEKYCQEKLGLSGALGAIDYERLNVSGGAIAIGHPVGASGARLILHLAHLLRSKGVKRGVASLCIGGGQGGAMLIESVDGV
ncbi:MAG: acetyl-CoA C-acetyltransferase [Gammaproteobacteria bacterium]